MAWLYLLSSVVLMASASILGALYNRKNAGVPGSAPLYNFVQMCATFVCWAVIFAFDRGAEAGVLPYALLFALFYTVCMAGMINALKTGPVVFTSLILQLSLIGVAVWGFFFWNEPIGLRTAAGLALVVLALWMCLYGGKSEKKSLGGKWLFFVFIMFVGNAGCSIVQRTQQTAFEGRYGAFLMFVATGISALFCAVLYARSDRSQTRLLFRTSAWLPVISGAGGAVLNLFVILLASTALSPSLIYPVIAVGGIAVNTLFSALVFREKLRWWQWAGVAVGALATWLLSM